MKFCWLVSFFLGLALPILAQTPPPARSGNAETPPPPPHSSENRDPFDDPLIQQIEARQRKAVAGDAQETKSLTVDLEKWTRDQPQNHLLQAYLGSLYTLCSRDAWPGPGKLTYLRRGGQLLDQAVTADPDNPAVRFVRAVDYFELPMIFGRRQTARTDFEVLVQQANGELKTPFTLDTRTAQAIYYYAGLSLEQQWLAPQAREAWRRGLSLDPTSELGLKIRGELARLK